MGCLSISAPSLSLTSLPTLCLCCTLKRLGEANNFPYVAKQKLGEKPLPPRHKLPPHSFECINTALLRLLSPTWDHYFPQKSANSPLTRCNSTPFLKLTMGDRHALLHWLSLFYQESGSAKAIFASHFSDLPGYAIASWRLDRLLCYFVDYEHYLIPSIGFANIIYQDELVILIVRLHFAQVLRPPRPIRFRVSFLLYMEIHLIYRTCSFLKAFCPGLTCWPTISAWINTLYSPMLAILTH